MEVIKFGMMIEYDDFGFLDVAGWQPAVRRGVGKSGRRLVVCRVALAAA